MKCLEATDSNGTELYLFQLEDNLFISVPKDQLEFKPLSLEEMKGLEKGEWIYTNDPLRLNDEWACSRCGNISFAKTNFCDRCGARMKGVDDDQTYDR